MTTQTRTWQRKVLESARRDGYAGLYWYTEMCWGAGKHHAPACYPGAWVPVVPVVPNPDATRRIADMLAYLFWLSNPATITFAAQLTSAEALRETGCRWYVWTDDVDVDAVCDHCGAVEVVGHTMAEGAPWLCEWCVNSISKNPVSVLKS